MRKTTVTIPAHLADAFEAFLASQGGSKAKSSKKGAKTSTKVSAAGVEGPVTRTALKSALGIHKANGDILVGTSVPAAIAHGLMTPEGARGPKAGKAKAMAAAKAATGQRTAVPTTGKKAPAKKATAKRAAKRPSPKPLLARDQACKKAGGTITRKAWDRSLTTALRTSGFRIGTKKEVLSAGRGQSFIAAVRDADVWAQVVLARDVDGATPAQVFSDLVSALEPRDGRTGKRIKALEAPAGRRVA